MNPEQELKTVVQKIITGVHTAKRCAAQDFKWSIIDAELHAADALRAAIIAHARVVLQDSNYDGKNLNNGNPLPLEEIIVRILHKSPSWKFNFPDLEPLARKVVRRRI